MTRKLISLLVEGHSDVKSVPVLAKQIITDLNGWQYVFLDKKEPLRVGGPSKLIKDDFKEWRNKLKRCKLKEKFGGAILLLDADVVHDGINRPDGNPYCLVELAKKLAEVATEEGANETFSIGITFVSQEFESWGIECYQAMSGMEFPDGLKMKNGLPAPASSPEKSPRSAKTWFQNHLTSGSYSETKHLETIAKHLDLGVLRASGNRSFLRFENSIKQLLDAIKNEKHIATP